MEFEQAAIIGRRRRLDAAQFLSSHIKERVTDLCAVKPAKGAGLDAKDWDPVGEENYKELVIRRSLCDEREAYLVVVDADGRAKACTQRTYPLPLALQMAQAIPLPTSGFCIYAVGGMSTLFRVDMQIVYLHGHAEQRGHATPHALSPEKDSRQP